MLQPSEQTKLLLARTRAKAKMYEYSVPIEDHFDTGPVPLSNLLDLTISMLGDIVASGEEGDSDDLKYKLIFSAQYFDALIESKTLADDIAHLLLLAAATYYLAGYPGSSSVILSRISDEDLYSPLEEVLLAVLKRKPLLGNPREGNFISTELTSMDIAWSTFLESGAMQDNLRSQIDEIRKKVYAEGSDRDLLMVDTIRAVVARRIRTSTWSLLPHHSGLTLEQWRPYLSRGGALQELWPAQVLLAKHGVFAGKSAVVQMPTSAGKTRSSELIIRSSFLSGRSTVAFIVAPFRALCQEIYNDLIGRFAHDANIRIDVVSDVLQEDIGEIQAGTCSVLILTPEKLDFLLRHNKSLAEQVGLVIYDEGHLFDERTRGVKYELLLSSLKRQLADDTQVILISAVISNAMQIKDWLIGQNGEIVEAKHLNPTNRSLAFASWRTTRGRLEFVDEKDIDQSRFFVARLLESQELELRQRERRERSFPERDEQRIYDSGQVAGFLGCKLSSEGLAAIFTGRKDSALKIAEDIIDAYDRGLNLIKPIVYAVPVREVDKFINYVKRLLGPESIQARAAGLGILIHHGSTPHGLRLAVECALQEMQFKTVICTSTLAQGVNLPIRYLIVSTDRQGKDQIKVRDFHNLMGRAGRSGKYTEGTIIFADPRIYDKRTSENWRWPSPAKIIDNSNSEPCLSRLLTLFDEEPENEDDKIEWRKNQDVVREEIGSQLLDVLSEVDDIREMEDIVSDVAKNTLGYFQLETDERKADLVGSFMEIGAEIMQQVPEITKRKSFAKSILNLRESTSLLESVQSKLPVIQKSTDAREMLTILFDLLYSYTKNSVLERLSASDVLKTCIAWINGESYPELLHRVKSFEIRGRKFKPDQIVDLCEGCFGYSMSLLIGSISELLNLSAKPEEIAEAQLQLAQLQKMLKYGLPGSLPISIYEAGFADRQLSLEIASILGDENDVFSYSKISSELQGNPQLCERIEENYPKYFVSVLRRVTRT